MKSRVKTENNSISYLKIFAFFLILLIILSYLIRFVKIVQTSTLNSHAFNILVKDKNTYLVNIDKDQKRVSVISIKDLNENFSSKKNAGIAIEIPIDSVIFTKETENNFKRDFFSFNNLIFNSKNLTLNGLNRFDLVRIYFYSKLYSSNLKEESVSINDLSQGDISGKIYDLLKDNIVVNEKISIEIINSSDVDGVGLKVSHMLKNVGFNVISITTADPANSSKIISRIDGNETLNRLESILGLPIEREKDSGVADISIVIGKDYFSK